MTSVIYRDVNKGRVPRDFRPLRYSIGPVVASRQNNHNFSRVFSRAITSLDFKISDYKIVKKPINMVVRFYTRFYRVKTDCFAYSIRAADSAGVLNFYNIVRNEKQKKC